MNRKLFTLVSALCTSVCAFAQLPTGSVAPDFTLTDINGASHHLYSYLDSGYAVIIDVSAAWNAPCWSAHQSHVFENLTTHYGKNGTISPGKVKVIYIEGESTNTTAQLHGTSSGTGPATYSQGDWIAGTNYPFIDNASQNANYLYGGFPSFTVICRDHLIAKTQAGYETSMNIESFWMDIINGGCPLYAPSATVDAKAVPYSGTGTYICNANPTVKFQNYSTNTLTSATINIISGLTTVATYPWTGSVAPYGIGTATIPSFAGVSFSSYRFEVNATGDTQPSNNTSRDSMFKVYAPGNAIATPWSENFEANTTLPYRMTTTDENNIFVFQSGNGYVLKGPTGDTTRGLGIAFGFIRTGGSAEVVLGNFNSAGTDNVALDFDVAYAQSTAANTDKIEIKVSNDCGVTWSTAWSKSGAALATTTPVNGNDTAFVPSNGSQWRHEFVLLTPYKGSNMIVKMVATSDLGNYGWMDNLKITNTLDVANVITTGSVSVYPNPARESATLDFMLNKSGQVMVNVVDAVGRTVAVTANAALQQGAQHIKISTASLAAGVYNIAIRTEEGTLTKRLTIVK